MSACPRFIMIGERDPTTAKRTCIIAANMLYYAVSLGDEEVCMKSWTISESKNLTLVEADGQPTPHELKVKITDVVLTHTDIALYTGRDKAKLPVIPGRLAVGLVSENAGDNAYMKGTRVLLSPYRDGKVRGLDIDGYLSDYVIAPKDCVIALPESVKNDSAIFAELIAIALRAIDKMKVEEGEFVAIMGADDFCLIAAQIVDYYHAIPIVVANDEEGLDIATELGVTYVIDAGSTNVVERVRNITNGDMCECAIVESYSNKVQNGFNLTRKKGRVCIVGPDGYLGDLPADLHNVVAKSLSVTSVTNGGKNLPAAINFLATEAISTIGLPSRNIAFDAIPETFASASVAQLYGPLAIVKVD